MGGLSITSHLSGLSCCGSPRPNVLFTSGTPPPLPRRQFAPWKLMMMQAVGIGTNYYPAASEHAQCGLAEGSGSRPAQFGVGLPPGPAQWKG